jgi:hypothetical protein
MSRAETQATATQQEADTEALMRLVSAGQPITDSGLRRRIRERADSVRRDIARRHGVVDWAVPMTRDARDE